MSHIKELTDKIVRLTIKEQLGKSVLAAVETILSQENVKQEIAKMVQISLSEALADMAKEQKSDMAQFQRPPTPVNI